MKTNSIRVHLSHTGFFGKYQVRYRFGEFELDLDNFQLSCHQETVEIEPKIFDLLRYMVSNQGRVISRAELFESIWPGQVVSEASLNNLIKSTRKAVNDNGEKQSVIKTVHGRGFQFVCGAEVKSEIDNLETTSLQGKRQTVASGTSIVVLPFTNLIGDSDRDFFINGISEEIVFGLGRYRELLVIAHDSSVLVSAQTRDAGEAARILGVSYALSGSVRISGERVKITVRLTEAKSRYQIWSEQYDRVLDDIFSLQEEVSQTIVNMLVGNIERTVAEQSLLKDVRNLSAYEFVLRGRNYFGDWSGSQENVRQAREMFEQAIKLDPKYAAAYSGLAGAHLWEFRFDWSNDREWSAVKCFENAEKAIELDPRDSFAYLALSGAYFHIKSDFEFAKSKLQTAIELNPNDYATYCYGCLISTCAGDLDVSVDHAMKARQRNPLLPDTCLWNLGVSEYLLNQYEDAIETLCKLSKNSAEVSACLAACYAQLGRVADAAKAVKEFNSKNNFPDMDKKAWESYWRNFLNFKEQEPVDHLIEGITKAKLVRTSP